MVVVSAFDQKPVHFLSSLCYEIKWITKTRKAYAKEHKPIVDVSFLQLNTNDQYNKEMGLVD
eukprot:6492717-Ditylum_brightwellii.AAC.1